MEGYIHMADLNLNIKAEKDDEIKSKIAEELSDEALAEYPGKVHLSCDIIMSNTKFNGVDVSSVRVQPVASGSSDIETDVNIHEQILSRLIELTLPDGADIELSSWLQVDPTDMNEETLKNLVERQDVKIFDIYGSQLETIGDVTATISDGCLIRKKPIGIEISPKPLGELG